MSNQMIINTRGDPLGTVHNLIRSIWREADFGAMLVPTNGLPKTNTGSRLIYDPDQLSQFNPFKPMMSVNSARFVPGIIKSHPDIHIGVVFRPCEMRALNSLTKRDGFTLDNMTTICVDCLGTYPATEFQWRAERKGSPEALTQETLQFARQGGILAYRYRGACQLCSEPDAQGADINICVLGIPVRQYILVTTQHIFIDDLVNFDRRHQMVDSMEVLNQRKQLIARLSECRNRTHERVMQGIADGLPTDIEALVEHLAGCGSCQECLEACPICVLDFPKRGDDNRFLIEEINTWLSACAGCGMCEQACPQHHPLSAIFSYIHKVITGETNYSQSDMWGDPLSVHQ